jgi:hypothetical protein
MTTLSVRLTFTEPLLGTVPKDPNVYSSYIAGRSLTPETTAEEEIGTVPEGASAEDRGWTGFHTAEDGEPFLYDYVIKGFFKDACSMLTRVDGTESKKLTAFRKCVDGLIFVKPRRIVLHLSGPLTPLERPLRAQTAQGERIALARSDAAPVGSWIEFEVVILGKVPVATILEWLDYGEYRGLGCWRNAAYGRFTYTFETVKAKA